MRSVAVVLAVTLATTSLASAIALSLRDSLTGTARTSVHYSDGQTTITQETLWRSSKKEVLLNAALVSVLPLAGVITTGLTLFKGHAEYRFVPVGIGVFGVSISLIFFLSASLALIVSSTLMLLAGVLSVTVPRGEEFLKTRKDQY